MAEHIKDLLVLISNLTKLEKYLIEDESATKDDLLLILDVVETKFCRVRNYFIHEIKNK